MIIKPWDTMAAAYIKTDKIIYRKIRHPRLMEDFKFQLKRYNIHYNRLDNFSKRNFYRSGV